MRSNNELIFKINSDLVNYAYKTIACKDEAFLKKTLTRIGKVGFKGQYFHVVLSEPRYWRNNSVLFKALF